MKGWIIPFSNRTPPEANICRDCEKRDPFLAALTDAAAGREAAPWPKWRRAEIGTCDHPAHKP